MDFPKIRISVAWEADASGRGDLSEYDDRDAAEILAGRLTPYNIEIIAPGGRILTDSINHIGPPGCQGNYESPHDIPDRWLAYYAADAWTWQCPVGIGDVVHDQGTHLRVIAFDHVDAEHGEIGYLTGWLLCRFADGHGLTAVHVTAVRRILEITA